MDWGTNNLNSLNDSNYTQSPVTSGPYVDDKGNKYASYKDYIIAQKRNYFIKFKNEAGKKQENYEQIKGNLAQYSDKKYSLYMQLKSDPQNADLAQQYNTICQSYSDMEIEESCAWWSWHGAVDSQQKAIIV